MSTTDVNDFLLSGGVPACKFAAIGATAKGTVVASEVTQQTNFDDGKPVFWDDGKPKMQVVVTLQTDDRDPEVDDDQGLRKLYVKGQMQAAVREALRVAGAKLEVGGTLAVQYVSEEPTKGFPKKIFKAAYKPGVGAVNDLLGDPQPAPSQPAVEDLI